MKLLCCVILLVSLSAAENQQPKIVVIGAGASGIGAAVRLFENNISVTVLEAENRIGGRVNSVPFGDAVVDLGAQWCMGENILYEIAKEYVGEAADGAFELLRSNRKPIAEDVQKQLSDLYYEFTKPGSEEGVTIGDYFIKEYKSKVNELYKNDNDNLEVAMEALEVFKHNVLGYDGSFDWFESSAKNSFEDLPGDQYLTWKGHGYRTALEVLMKPHPNLRPEFGKEVLKIRWDDTVNITCVDGSTYEVDHVIFTPSIGVIRHDHAKLFEPALPSDKIVAAEKMGFGAVMKVHLKFPNVWWEDFFGYGFAWTPEDKVKAVQEFRKGPIEGNTSWLFDFRSVMQTENNPKVLLAWFTGKFVPEIERLSDDVIIDGAMYVFEKFLGHKYNITRPTETKRENWHNNPHFRGVYSYETVESRKLKPSSHSILARPLTKNGIPRVLFAGEATNENHYGSVHGAVETGRREADRLVSYLQRNLISV